MTTTAKGAKQKTPEPAKSAEKVLNASALDDLIADSENTEAAGRGFMEPAAVASKKKRGRPSNAEKQAREGEAPPKSETGASPGPDVQPAPDSRPFCKSVFQIASAALGRYAGDTRVCLLSQEIELLGDAWGPVVDKYLPAIFAEHGALIVACGVTAQVGMRLKGTVDQIRHEREFSRARESAAARGSSEKPRAVDTAAEMTQ